MSKKEMEVDYGCVSSDDEYHDSVYEGDELHEAEDENELFGTSCKVIRKESLLAAQKEDLKEVMVLLSLKEHHARTLLIHYQWNVDKVLDVLLEKGKKLLYAETGVVVDSDNHSSSHVLTNIVCQICFEEFPANETTAGDCGHCFCSHCWTEYFIVKINEGQSKRITCMAHKCNAICDEEKIRNLVSARNPRLAEKFDRFLLESYIEDNKRVKWCPSVPHCGNAIRVEKDEYCEVECACGQQFCFSCSYEAHSPCSCRMWELWRKKCGGELDTVNWIATNTKDCPKCHKPMQKIGGCNLVQCICGQSFCWLCGGVSGFEYYKKGIINHQCGQYKEENVAEDESAEKERRYAHYYSRYIAHTNSLNAEATLEEKLEHKIAEDESAEKERRYAHYYSRYVAHTNSLNAEATLEEKLEHKIATLKERKLALSDFSWVPNGFYRLLRSRQILSYSYPFAYYMFGDELFRNEMTQEENAIKKNLFENQQEQLEKNVERLSMFLEKPFAEYSQERIMNTRTKIINLCEVINKLCKRLYECIENELLGPLQCTTHIIAPYRSSCVDKASELLPDTFLTKAEREG